MQKNFKWKYKNVYILGQRVVQNFIHVCSIYKLRLYLIERLPDSNHSAFHNTLNNYILFKKSNEHKISRMQSLQLLPKERTLLYFSMKFYKKNKSKEIKYKTILKDFNSSDIKQSIGT